MGWQLIFFVCVGWLSKSVWANADSNPFPLVICVGLPLSGSSFMTEYLEMKKFKYAHYPIRQHSTELCRSVYPVAATKASTNTSMGILSSYWPLVNRSDACYVGLLIQKAIGMKLPPFHALTSLGFHAFTKLDVCRPSVFGLCVFPQVESLDEIVSAYPDAYYVMTRRSNVSAHVMDIEAWDGMLERFKSFGYLSKYPGQSPSNSNLINGQIMLETMTNITSSFFKQRPHLKFLDIDTNDPQQDAMGRVSSFLSDLSSIVVSRYTPEPVTTAAAGLKGQLIIEVGLPKSGTSSLFQALTDVGIKSCHYGINSLNKRLCEPSYPIKPVNVSTDGVSTHWKEVRQADGCYVGVLMQKALVERKKPLQYLEELGYQAYLQLDVCRWKDRSNLDFCIVPQIFALDELTTAYPHAFYIHTRRATTPIHANSMLHWGDMLVRFKHYGYLSRYEGQRENNTLLHNAEVMIDAMTNITLSYFQRRPHLKVLDVAIEDVNAANKIAEFLGIPTLSLEAANVGMYHKNTNTVVTSSSSSTNSINPPHSSPRPRARRLAKSLLK